MELNTLYGLFDNATETAVIIDNASYWMHIIVVGLMMTVILPMFYIVWKYHHSRHPAEKVENIEHNFSLEIAWTIIPTIFLMVIFYYGFISAKSARTMPTGDDVVTVKVKGVKWAWSYQYADGKKTDKLYVPIDTDILLKMTAPINDVIHSFYIAAFRIKEDVVPGRVTKMWFNANKLGEYDVQCAEYCGERHSYMYSKVVVIPKEAYNTWIASNNKYPGGPALVSEPRGKIALNDNGCTSCHSLDGSPLVGPSFGGIGSRTIKTDKGSFTADKQYLIDAIETPNKDIVEGFASGMMPGYKGVISDKDIEAIADYLLTLK